MTRLQEYLLTEARVETSTADVFLREYSPIFMWNPTDGFFWSVYDKSKEKWMCYEGGRFMKIDKGDPSYDYKAMTHYRLSALSHLEIENDDGFERFVTGRISPDGKTIYIHGINSNSRNYNINFERNFDRYVDKAVNAVYKYMRDYIR
jgi:hypothetical protein